jgi:hypothetical protein
VNVLAKGSQASFSGIKRPVHTAFAFGEMMGERITASQRT